jgi:hypothetical protein
MVEFCTKEEVRFFSQFLISLSGNTLVLKIPRKRGFFSALLSRWRARVSWGAGDSSQ